jgi:hypothetical protein
MRENWITNWLTGMPTAALWESCKLRSKSTLANGRVRRNRQCCATSFVAPAYGAKEVSTSLIARKDTGCYKYLLQEFGTELPKVQQSAIDALDDPDPDLVQGAVLALGRWGASDAETALWVRSEAVWRILAGRSTII